jgi:hypothetical protein
MKQYTHVNKKNCQGMKEDVLRELEIVSGKNLSHSVMTIVTQNRYVVAVLNICPFIFIVGSGIQIRDPE